MENRQVIDMDPIDHEAAFFRDLCSDLCTGHVDLPTLPDVALRVKKVLDDPKCSAEKVVRVISLEPVLSAHLIKMANSAAFSRDTKSVSDLQTALTLVGFDIARNTAVSIAIKQAFNPSKAKHLKLHLKKLWGHSLKVAAIAYVLPNKPSNITADEAMLAGLVHDIGKFYILMRADSNPALFHDLAILDDLTLRWHAGVGKVILETWGFSEEMIIAADEHEILDQNLATPPSMTDVVIVANLLAHIGRFSPYKEINLEELASFKKLGINNNNTTDILKKSQAQVNSMIQALN